MSGQQALTGSAEDARTWIRGSRLSGSEQALLLSFTRAFPELTFSRDDAATRQVIEEEISTRFPETLWRTRAVLAMVLPGERVRVSFQQGVHDEASGEPWYTLDLPGFAVYEDMAGVLEVWQLYPVTDLRDTGASTLFMTGRRPEIYEGNLEDLFTGQAVNQGGEEAWAELQRNYLTRMFDSYAHLLGEIRAVLHLQPNRRALHVRQP
ncbi:hypothetical protein [Deinococcus altitudinis]|uniref:hypothetical protein n=1 Tax=Deinococcus altitudinis TaxID=468914 RepID=UPI003892B759